MKNLLSEGHLVEVPLDYSAPDSTKITVFCREVYQAKNKKAPLFVYLQGGPGFPCAADNEDLDWAKVILEKYRLLFVDQRGTGKSTKIGPELIAKLKTPQAIAEYLSHHRADNIARDVEYIRENVFKLKKLFLIGQSFGGFVACHYLSFYPGSLNGVIITGGLPPLTIEDPFRVYEKLVSGIQKRNQEFSKTYPEDAKKLKKIISLLRTKPVALGDGSDLNADRFLDIGILLGKEKGLKTIHNLIHDPYLDSSEKEISWAFATQMSRQLNYETNPIYALLHESIYCEGVASNWAADRALKAHRAFSKQEIFYGETIRKNMFLEYAKLKEFQAAAEILAQKSEWPQLYDKTQLSKNAVPVECIIYKNDFYVDYQLSLETLKLIKNAKAWVHPTWHHDGLREHGKEVAGKLLTKLRKRVKA